MYNILVTGGAGFVGSHLCEKLVESGHHVVSLDDYSMGSEDNHIEGVTYINGNTQNILSLIPFSVDYVYHLGEYSRVEQSFEDYEKVWQSNILGTKAVLDYVKQSGAKLIYSGSSTKFAHVEVKSPYQWSKASNTEFVKNFCEWNDIEYAITYFYNVYGKREISHGKYATLIAKFREAMKNNEPLTVVSPGIQTRNFTHVDDIVDALILVGFNGIGDEFGIGNDTDYSILKVATMFGGKVNTLAPRPGNRMGAPVMDQKTRELGWVPTRNLKDWIKTLKENDWNVK